jgi:ribosomal-protein-alanine N-acetyltransferase
MEFPVVETERLILTALNKDDANAIFELFSDNAVVKYYDLDAFSDVSQALKLITLFQSRFEEKVGIRWAMRLKDTEQFLGTCGFNSWNLTMRHAVIGYDLLPRYWGKGYTSEALHRLVAAAFGGELACGVLNRIQADTVPGNDASEAVLRKVGFQEEGVRRQSGYWKGQFHDLKCFGLLKSEYKGI